MANLPPELNQDWEVIVVGAGMGGATLGYALARAGRKVLLIEKGRSRRSHADVIAGQYAECRFPAADVPRDIYGDTLLRAGRWPQSILDHAGNSAHPFVPFIGCGTGGSSALYGMAMERFFAHDFTPGAVHRSAFQAAVPAAWPVTYADLAPYYEQAEKLYRVRGGRDPLRANEDLPGFLAPPPLSAPNAELCDFFNKRGLHPYRLPMACEYVPKCAECQGFLCPEGCKNDSETVCLRPAIDQHSAGLMDECDVIGIEAGEHSVKSIDCMRGGERFTLALNGGILILAAGALHTPYLLLNSKSRHWPTGLANDSGLVGKNLMRHCIDLYAVSTRASAEDRMHLKQIAFNDFYVDGHHLGTVQSFGKLLPSAFLAAAMAEDAKRAGVPWLSGLLRLMRPMIEKAISGKLHGKVILASIMEDMPYHDNEVRPLDKGVSIRYRLHEYERKRTALFRSLLKEVFSPYRLMLIKQAENNERIAHVCGTCRFGSAEKESVLNKNNRAHGVDNLYIVDSSFFPSSTGTNPSLTIAANALRVADEILRTTLSR